MSRFFRKYLTSLALLGLIGCAGWDRSCASCNAQSFGADWVIVQMDNNGRPYRCWNLAKVSVANETQSDGVYWTEASGYSNLVHISGHYNRVQVVGGNWDKAYAELGLTKETCAEIQDMRYDPKDGVYKPKQ